jgi:hypothetical protein
MKIIAFFLFFSAFGFSQEPNLAKVSQILELASDSKIELEKSISVLNQSLAGNDTLTIFHRMLCVDRWYVNVVVLQEQAKNLLREIKKEKYFSFEKYSDEEVQLNELNRFSKRSFNFAVVGVKVGYKRIKCLQKNKGKIKVSAPSRAFLLFQF